MASSIILSSLASDGLPPRRLVVAFFLLLVTVLAPRSRAGSPHRTRRRPRPRSRNAPKGGSPERRGSSLPCRPDRAADSAVGAMDAVAATLRSAPPALHRVQRLCKRRGHARETGACALRSGGLKAPGHVQRRRTAGGPRRRDSGHTEQMLVSTQ